jgi:hypothetical protein
VNRLPVSVRDQTTLPRILQLEASNLGTETYLSSLRFIVVFPIKANSRIVGLPAVRLRPLPTITFTIHFTLIIPPFDAMLCELLTSSLKKSMFQITLFSHGYVFIEYRALLRSLVVVAKQRQSKCEHYNLKTWLQICNDLNCSHYSIALCTKEDNIKVDMK